MGKLRRKRCDGHQCRDPAFFTPARPAAGGGTFFAPDVQKQDAPQDDEEKKDPLAEGVKQVVEKLGEHEPMKKFIEPRLLQLKMTLWDKLGLADKVALSSVLGAGLGTVGAGLLSSAAFRQNLSGVNIGKPLGWIPYSPVEGFKVDVPKKAGAGTGLSADFTLDPLLSLTKKQWPRFPLTAATLGLDASLDPATDHLRPTGGRLGLEFFDGALKAEGRTFTEISPYPLWVPGRVPGDPSGQLMGESPGLPALKLPGAQFMLSADMLKLFPWLRKNF